MEYNKNEKITRYYDLDSILKLNISDKLKKEFKDKFKRKVFYDKNDSCRIGTLVGLEKNNKLLETYYILDINGNYHFIPTWKSITKVCV